MLASAACVFAWLSARVCAQAKGREILVSGELKARVPDASYVEARTVELKGISEPQAIHRLGW